MWSLRLLSDQGKTEVLALMCLSSRNCNTLLVGCKGITVTIQPPVVFSGEVLILFPESQFVFTPEREPQTEEMIPPKSSFSPVTWLGLPDMSEGEGRCLGDSQATTSPKSSGNFIQGSYLHRPPNSAPSPSNYCVLAWHGGGVGTRLLSSIASWQLGEPPSHPAGGNISMRGNSDTRGNF